MITSLRVNNFTAFSKAEIDLSPGLNVLIGKNSTGKSHLLKLMYAVCAAKPTPSSLYEANLSDLLTRKLFGLFKPEKKIGRLCREGRQKAEVAASFDSGMALSFAFSSDMEEVIVTSEDRFSTYKLVPVFLPPKEMLSSFPGFSSLYLQREIAADETYFDLSQALETPPLRENPNEVQTAILSKLESAIGGEFVLMKQKQFYYKPKDGQMLEVDLAAEGFRKLGMLQRLIQNGRVNPGVSGSLFWDEPEANLNPSIMKLLVDSLMTMCRAGQQVILSTHDYVTLKWIDLLSQDDDQVRFHALYPGEDGVIIHSTDDYERIEPNAIDDAYAELVDADVRRSMGGLGQ
jgi:energy-coupling factor transporter ATP-binding protein EcfA2